ncbi:hypothetical protein [Nocardia brasiliensis]|uniref:hypothetical protein n=1 Tax=Nocardia brasiliensis TaxID=37326 RepID=UPI002455F7B1|nr:hypothetical protein [Nocardia brasiliensis]
MNTERVRLRHLVIGRADPVVAQRLLRMRTLPAPPHTASPSASIGIAARRRAR